MKRQLIYLGLIVSFVLSSANSNAQFWDTYQQSYSYFGNTLINPGFSYGLQRSVWDSDKGSGFAVPFGRTTLNGSGTAALYWDPFLHVGFVNYYECNIRQYLGQRLGVQFGAGPGFQMNFTGDNYVIDDDFNVNRRGLLIDPYFMLQASAAIFLSDRAHEKHWISKVSLFFLTPYNTSVLPGLNYQFTYQF